MEKTKVSIRCPRCLIKIVLTLGPDANQDLKCPNCDVPINICSIKAG
ncbi:ZnF protein [Anopheles marajoara virus]|uniref:ZnF protein n=1 Tax=Anopheles marajoara virus TaxID=2546225 RepID=A0AAE5YIH3_9MONO|nr:ZnF protein [Anopheles marajoara virus]QBK47215.1 ZnF protein [Anopheles marajoara virus]